jgi:hypothetical protein
MNELMVPSKENQLFKIIDFDQDGGSGGSGYGRSKDVWKEFRGYGQSRSKEGGRIRQEDQVNMLEWSKASLNNNPFAKLKEDSLLAAMPQ